MFSPWFSFIINHQPCSLLGFLSLSTISCVLSLVFFHYQPSAVFSPRFSFIINHQPCSLLGFLSSSTISRVLSLVFFHHQPSAVFSPWFSFIINHQPCSLLGFLSSSTISRVLSFVLFRAIIISGSPGSVSERNTLSCDISLLNSEIPILGICYGMQVRMCVCVWVCGCGCGCVGEFVHMYVHLLYIFSTIILWTCICVRTYNATYVCMSIFYCIFLCYIVHCCFLTFALSC